MSSAVIGDERLAGADLALQEPVHRDGPRHVSGDGVDRAALVAGELVRERAEEAVAQLAVDGVRDAGLVRLDRALARHEPHLHPQELVEPEPALRLARGVDRRRLVDVVERERAVDELQLLEHVGGQRLGELADPLQRQRDDRLHLPRGDVGLPRLRVDRDDHARLRTGTTEDVDDRVRELALAAVDVQFPVEGDLGALGQLLRAPGLVEEHEVDRATRVPDHGLDHRLALARLTRRDGCHLGDDRRLLAHCEVGDVGLVRAVVVAARVVDDEIEHRLDGRRQGRELVEHAGRDPRDVAERCRGQAPERARRDYSTPIRYG